MLMKQHIRITLIGFLSVFYVLALVSCGDKGADISILQSNDVFYQTESINNKLDIMFVVDNSGSMLEEQVNLATNFNSFISDFVTKAYDFKISVISSEAWKSNYPSGGGFTNTCNVGTNGSPVTVNCARFRDGHGVGAGTHSGIFTIDTNTPNIVDVFNINVRTGTIGYGDERVFQSMMTALDYNAAPNNTFLRDDSFLAVVMVSDEDDFSWDSSSYNPNYNNTELFTIPDVVDYLDTKTNSTVTNRRYNVSSIAPNGTSCMGAEGHHGTRQNALADATEGVKGSICSASFATTLNEIQTRISELSTQFYLTRIPIVSTIVVKVNSAVVPKNDINGWSYNSVANSIKFHGSAIPSQGSQIAVDFDPVSLD